MGVHTGLYFREVYFLITVVHITINMKITSFIYVLQRILLLASITGKLVIYSRSFAFCFHTGVYCYALHRFVDWSNHVNVKCFIGTCTFCQSIAIKISFPLLYYLITRNNCSIKKVKDIREVEQLDNAMAKYKKKKRR